MRRLLSFLMAVIIVFAASAALADVDLAGMSYDELVELQRAAAKEIMSRPEWKEVEVPAGQYTIGVDIPAGVYSVTPKNEYRGVYLRWYPRPDDNYWDYVHIYDKLARFDFYEGMRIYTEDTAIFAPPIALGF